MNASYSLTERLAQHLLRPVDAATRARARLHLLDWLGCVAGAIRSEVAGIARRATSDPLRRAALLGSVLEMDDVDRMGRVHPGPVVWAAALMEARLRQPAMTAMLDAGVRGVEATVAVARMLDDRHYAYWHPTHTAGRFGSAAVAASCRGMDAPTTAHAMAIAGSSAGALWQVRHEAASSKAFHVADAVLGGLFAGDFARAGMTGPLRVLEGEQGVFAAMCHAPGRLAEADGWLIAELSFKPWAACRHCHPAIDAALELRARGQLTPPFRIEAYADAVTFCDWPDPVTEAQAKFSLQHAVAVIAAGRDAGCSDFGAEAIGNPGISALRAQVEVVVAADITARYPAHFGALLNAGGATFALTDTRGDPERPLDEAGIVAKTRGLFAWGGVDNGEAAVTAALTGDDPARIVALLDGWLS